MRRAAVAALTASTLLGGLAASGTASAASNKYVEIKLCSRSSETVKFYIVGENQFGDWGGSPFWEVGPQGCTVAKDYWWKANQSVEFHHRKPSTGWRWEQRYLPSPKKN